jgi:hypothetical protein
LPPSANSPVNIFEEHGHLLRSFGGITERFNEPEDSWLLNLNDALTERLAANDASVVEFCKWVFDDAGLVIPIALMDYYSIAYEANGNQTFCHRRNGNVVLFAQDHSFDFVTPLAGCPDYTLYELNGVRSFLDWVEVVAKQWLKHIDMRNEMT